VWLFKKSGIQFRAKDDKYLVTKPGATIKFTPKGIEMTGVEKTKAGTADTTATPKNPK